HLRLVDTYGALILTHLIVGLPIIIWVMIGFFEDVPAELEDASLIDGCSYFGTFWRVALPLVKPGVVATAILSFVFSWNNFLFSVILAGRQTRTLPIAVFNMISYEEINWGTLAAAATLITLPVLLLALIVQRHIVTVLRLGAAKQCRRPRGTASSRATPWGGRARRCSSSTAWARGSTAGTAWSPRSGAGSPPFATICAGTGTPPRRRARTRS